jgi:4-diphosphocytidyl-2-C-methyl-D-erythritol kinase
MLFQPTNRSLTTLAPAKLNLYLRVLRRREDGFHDLETVMTSIDLFDTLRFEPCETAEVRLRVVMSGQRSRTMSAPAPIPVGSENLVVRAAQLLKEYAGSKKGVEITLIKRIPSAAGMGGGSSDAAATLASLNRFWGLSCRCDELLKLAASLGSDINFFLAGSSTAICRGRGEQVEPLPLSTCLYFVIAKPDSGLSTPHVFKHCRPINDRRSLELFVDALKRPGSGRMVRLLLNDLQLPAESLNEDVKQLRCRFSKLPVLGHQMSGSGSSYFGICPSFHQARMMASRLRSAGIPWVQVARSCT